MTTYASGLSLGGGKTVQFSHEANGMWGRGGHSGTGEVALIVVPPATSVLVGTTSCTRSLMSRHTRSCLCWGKRQQLTASDVSVTAMRAARQILGLIR